MSCFGPEANSGSDSISFEFPEIRNVTDFLRVASKPQAD
jgi:hypothetical protein